MIESKWTQWANNGGSPQANNDNNNVDNQMVISPHVRVVVVCPNYFKGATFGMKLSASLSWWLQARAMLMKLNVTTELPAKA